MGFLKRNGKVIYITILAVMLIGHRLLKANRDSSYLISSLANILWA